MGRQTWPQSIMFCKWRSHSAKSWICLPRGTHTQNRNHRHYIDSLPPCWVSETRTQTWSQILPVAGVIPKQPLAPHAPCQPSEQRVLQSAAQQNTRDFSASTGPHPGCTWRLEDKRGGPCTQEPRNCWDRQRVRCIKVWYSLEHLFILWSKQK